MNVITFTVPLLIFAVVILDLLDSF